MDDIVNEAIHGAVTEVPVAGQKKIPVMEIFGPTIQGEGSMIGVQTMFIRFGLCDYRCSKCDSLHAVLPEHVKSDGKWLLQEEIFREIVGQLRESNCQWVTFSGGNPCMHDLTWLVYALHSVGVKVQVETQGTLWHDWVMICDAVVISPKSPGMGEKFEGDKFLHFLDKLALHPEASVKIVVFSQADIEFACDVFDLPHAFWYPPRRKYISLGNPFPPFVKGGPVWPTFSVRELLKSYEIMYEEVLQNRRTRDVITLPQLHVILWGNKRGV